MSLRRKLKDEKLARIRENLAKVKAQAERAWRRLRRAWTRFDKLNQRIQYLYRAQSKREAELDVEPATGGGCQP